MLFQNNNLSHRTALEWAKEFAVIARGQKDPIHLAQAETALMIESFVLGENNKAMEIGHLALSYVHFDQASHERIIDCYAGDQRVLTPVFLAYTLWYGGKVKKAQALIATEPMPDLKHAASRGYLLTTYLVAHYFMKNIDRVKSISEEVLQLAKKYGYAAWVAWGLYFHGWVLAKSGEAETGVAKIRQGINDMAGNVTLGTLILGMLAESLWLMGKQDEALETLEESFAHSKKRDEFFFLPQLNHMKGQWLQELGAEASEIEHYFKEAINVARKQEAPMLELQASLSLAKYWQTSNRKQDIHSLLTELLERITPIIDTDVIPEYKEAREILSTI